MTARRRDLAAPGEDEGSNAYDHEVRHPPDADVSPTVTVATALGAVLEESPMELSPPIESVVDTDALCERVEEGAEPGDRLTFDYRECTVHVHADGRIGIETEELPDLGRSVPDKIRRLVEDRYIPGTGREQDERRQSILASYRFLRERGSARRSDFIEAIYPRYPGAYDIPHGGWWETVIKPGLGACPDVAKGNSMWYYVGD
jgi:hypothetical protein